MLACTVLFARDEFCHNPVNQKLIPGYCVPLLPLSLAVQLLPSSESGLAVGLGPAAFGRGTICRTNTNVRSGLLIGCLSTVRGFPTSSDLLRSCKDFEELGAKSASGWGFGLRCSYIERHRVSRRCGHPRRREVSRVKATIARDIDRVGMFLGLGKPGEYLDRTRHQIGPDLI